MLNKEKKYGFLPGCSLSSYNPAAVVKTTEYLRDSIPKFSAILKCCGKPTKDIGQYELFKKRFAGLLQDIGEVHVDEMIFACPNCKATFDKESEVQTTSLWELLPQIGLPEEIRGKAKDSDMVFTIHDACSARFDREMQNGVRWILDELGYKYTESEYSRENTRCCGFGGQINPVNPKMAERVMKRRIETLGDYPVVVYCASCRSAFMQNDVKAWHILDLIWGPVVYANDEPNADVLECPGEVWHNRFETRKQLQRCFVND